MTQAIEFLQEYREPGRDDLYAAAQLERESSELLAQRVIAARHQGMTWDRIAESIGITRQGVIRRYRKRVEETL